MARSLILYLVWLQVQWSEKSSYLKQFLWSNAEQSKEWLPHRDVTTSRPCQVTTSGQQCRSQQFSNVATLPHCDVITSRCHHVATSARKPASHHLMYEELGNEGIGRRTTRSTEFQSRATQSSRNCSGFVPLFIFWIFLDIMMMFLILDILFFSFMMF